jgi:putative membrane protein
MKLQERFSLTQLLTAILLIFYLVGTIGIALHPLEFAKLTPFNLLLTLGLCLWPHQPKDTFFFIQLSAIFLASFLLEYVGVNSGLIFGHYTYGNALGPKLGSTPLMIGINWVIVVYSSLQLVQTISTKLKVKLNALTGAGLAALAMVALDLLIEPLAPKLDFWEFNNLQVPLQNYTAWFFFGFIFCYWLIKAGVLKNNPMGWRVYLVQFVFFLILNLSL